MRAIRESSVKAFLERVGPHLRQHAAENNLLLGLLSDLANAVLVSGRDTGDAAPLLLFVEGAQREVEAVALQTPPRALIVSRAAEDALCAIVELAIAANPALPGVVGPSETAARVAAMWTAQTGRGASLRMDEMVYELERVKPPARSPGRLREAMRGDENLLAAWSSDFIAETKMDPISDCRAFVRGKMAARQLFVWDDGGPVTMVAWMGRTELGVRIGYVYTPPASRKRGYASAAVAALSQRLLDEGCPRCFLFTQAANPTSNKIYQAIGYRRVSDFRMYDFAAL